MSDISIINRKRFDKYIAPVTEILNDLDIFYWLDFGTLLGAVRDEVISDWDHDFDLATLDIDRKKLIIAKKRLESKGFKVVLQKNLPWFEDLMQIYIPRSNLETDNKGRIRTGVDHIDIYIYTKIDENLCMRRLHEPINSSLKFYNLFRMINKLNPQYSDTKISGMSKHLMSIVNFLPTKAKRFFSKLGWCLYLNTGRSSWLVSPCELLMEFSKTTLYGIDFNIPKNYDRYLEYRYSENWKIPDASWDTNNNGGRFTKKIKNNGISHISVRTIQNHDKYLWEE